MTRPRPPASYRFLAALIVHAVMAALMLLPMAGTPTLSGGFPHLDKVVHGAIWLVLALVTGYAIRARTLRGWARVIVLLVLEGVVVESLQGLTPHRSADPWDAVADALGAVLGAFVGWFRSRNRG